MVKNMFSNFAVGEYVAPSLQNRIWSKELTNKINKKSMASFILLTGITIVLGFATGLFLTLVMPKFWIKKVNQ